MIFAAVPTADAVGAYLAHAAATPGGTLRKGTCLTAPLVERLLAAGLNEVTVARLEEGDLHEDAAAIRIARALAGPGISAEPPATGRSNLHADQPGLFAVDPAVIDAINRLDPAITVATRPAQRGVEAGRMVATVKIIPFAVPAALVAAAEMLAKEGAPALSIAPYRPLRVAVVSTLLPSLKAQTIAKTLEVLAARLEPAGASIVTDRRVPHETGALTAALADLAPIHDLTIVFGASAVVDQADVVPAAVELAGGEVIHLGMPVDPGNLLLLGQLAGRPLLGAPGCARSPRENGFDFVLERILAGQMPSARDIMGMGVGGLLMDIVSRPAPRTGDAIREDPDAPVIAGIVLAAGLSSRFAAGSKLLAKVGAKPMVRLAVEAALAGGLAEVIVVTGHAAADIEAALKGLSVRLVHNPHYREGQSTSLKAGIAALGPDVEAAMVLLGDMPGVDGGLVRRIAEAYRPAAGALIVAPVHGGRRGNPVLWSRRYFGELAGISGDEGARRVIAAHGEALVTVPADAGATVDLDTVEDLAAWQASTTEA